MTLCFGMQCNREGDFGGGGGYPFGMPPSGPFVSRAGEKLEHALASFGLDVSGRVCADLGCNVGGFTDCLLKRGAAKVFAVDTGYGVLDYKLRKDPRVVVRERTNALHVELGEAVSLVVIDVAWTRQKLILPAARKLLEWGRNVSSGQEARSEIVTLIKPHYEAPKSYLKAGILDADRLPEIIEQVKAEFAEMGFSLKGLVDSPIKGTGGNAEALAWLGLGSSAESS